MGLSTNGKSPVLQSGNEDSNSSSSIIQIHQTDGSLFYPMVYKFLERSGDHEMSADLIVEQIINAQGKWIIFNEKNEPKGYFFADIQKTEYRSSVVLVGELYIDPKWKNGSAIRQADQVLEEWGHSRGASEIAFYTRRNPKVFCKRLGNGWNIDSHVLKRAI